MRSHLPYERSDTSYRGPAMAARSFRRFFQRSVVMVGSLILLHYYLKGNIDEYLVRPYNEFQYPLEIDLRKVISRLKKNESINITPITDLPFKFSSTPKCPEQLLAAVLVKSAVTNGNYRQTVRATWGNQARAPPNVRLYFHLGSTLDSAVRNEIELEEKRYEDLVQSDFIDAYYNNTFKSIMGLRWASLHCKGARYVLFVDDDYYVSLQNLVTLLQSLGTHAQSLWMGYLCLNGEPDRRHWPYAGKWQVSRTKYPYQFWPPFMNGGSYLLSSDLITDFYLASQFTEFIAMDDVFLGIIAKKLGVKGMRNETLFPNPGVPRMLLSKDHPNLKHVVANHRFGKYDEVEYIWKRFVDT